MNTTETTEERPAPVLLDRLNGGRGIVRVGDTVTPKAKGERWDEYNVVGFSVFGLDLKAPDGNPGFGLVSEFLLTSPSEIQARAQLESVREMVAALKAADDKLLTERAVGTAYGCDVDARDKAHEAIEQDALSVEVRSDWWTLDQYAEESKKPSSFKICLCTGGPAVQIVGTLDENQEPETVELQHQDWGTPWTEYRLTVAEQEAVLEYCRQFCFA